ncbi:helicase associated domain-containing protein [Curtobacterium sp. MCBD17_040]|uniref:helicase associated domain-containing protein n=1 Tax=Curtobacterium sp. MCBD17_040 TaxID=2175674 RepID=UPI0015E8B4D9|nr:helicase associated domain-containing protein [Curtobacterium sp. MCBD17_040]WIB65558.1 helicase associated domain-containing protein [Curtobacterium sp. MCBD17_040]
MTVVTIIRKRDIGGVPNDTRFGERRRAGDEVTLVAAEATTDPTFEEGFDRVLAYVATHGTASVPQLYVEPDGYPTGMFVANLRKRHARGSRIDPSQLQRLEALPGWVWNAKEAKYQAALNHLRRYVAKTGSVKMPPQYTTDDGFKLGSWVEDQRAALTAQKSQKRKMTPERKAELEVLPGWVWASNEEPLTAEFVPQKDSFERGLELMREYIAKHGNADVPNSYNRPSDVFNLGIWAKNQRAATKPGSQRPMTAEHRAALEALPSWSSSLRWTKATEPAPQPDQT